MRCKSVFNQLRAVQSLLAVVMLASALGACGKSEEAKIETPAKPVTAAPVPVAEMPATVDGAAKFAASCASCHGATGQGQGTFPKVAGLTAEDAKSKMNTYKSGGTIGSQSAMMTTIAAQLSDAELEALAEHIATLK